MARTPNYNFERKERERLKAAKKAEKQAAKAAAKERTATESEAETEAAPADEGSELSGLVADEDVDFTCCGDEGPPRNHRRLAAGQGIVAGLQRRAMFRAAFPGPLVQQVVRSFAGRSEQPVGPVRGRISRRRVFQIGCCPLPLLRRSRAHKRGTNCHTPRIAPVDPSPAWVGRREAGGSA